MRRSSGSATFKLARKNPDGTTTAVAARVSYVAETPPPTRVRVYRAIPNPDASLQRGRTYVATVTPGARDLAGNGLDQSPTVAATSPRPGASR